MNRLYNACFILLSVFLAALSATSFLTWESFEHHVTIPVVALIVPPQHQVSRRLRNNNIRRRKNKATRVRKTRYLMNDKTHIVNIHLVQEILSFVNHL
jgi:ABC-type antimicrobial peptide transport system permease subunit